VYTDPAHAGDDAAVSARHARRRCFSTGDVHGWKSDDVSLAPALNGWKYVVPFSDPLII
jgi:hypothetical protein